MGVSRQAVTKWEADQTVPSMEHLIKLSEIFNVPLNQLANGSVKELQTETNEPTTDEKDTTILMANLTILATMFVSGASNGFYQGVYLGDETPRVVWLCITFIGGIFLMIRDRLYYKNFQICPNMPQSL